MEVLYLELWEGIMALWHGQLVGGPVPEFLNPRRTQPIPRTFLGACVDEALERRANPWDPARLHREWVVEELGAIRQQLTALRARSKASTRPLQPAERRLVAVLMDLGDIGSLTQKEIARKVRPKLKPEHRKFGRSTLSIALDYFRDGTLPPRR
jgi:hypothetical protein